MFDLGKLSYFLGMEFKETSEWVFLHQKKCTQDILKRLKMSNYNDVATPLESRAKLKKNIIDEFVSATMYKEIIGSLRYLCNTRPNICRSVILLRRLMEKPQQCYFTTIKRVLRYIKGMLIIVCWCQDRKRQKIDAVIYGYTDSYYSGDQDEKRVLQATYSWYESLKSLEAQGSITSWLCYHVKLST